MRRWAIAIPGGGVVRIPGHVSGSETTFFMTLSGSQPAISCESSRPLLKASRTPVEAARRSRRVDHHMHPRACKKIFRVTVLLALLGLFAAPRGLVFCVESTGQVSIESIVACQLMGNDAQFDSNSVDSCNDTRLISDVLKARGETEVVWAVVAILVAVSHPPALAVSPAAPSSPPASSFWLREHRTIVLLV